MPYYINVVSKYCELGSCKLLLFFFFWVYSAKNAGKPKSRICLASTYRVLATCKVILVKRMAALESNQGPTVERIRTEKKKKYWH